mmetsp:Transcript_3510/g.10171  ORF Transcript_3510/g.10171 Transcript_3510/m.10171 type:complete len:160 (+) Transcript_3510:513-992(+)
MRRFNALDLLTVVHRQQRARQMGSMPSRGKSAKRDAPGTASGVNDAVVIVTYIAFQFDVKKMQCTGVYGCVRIPGMVLCATFIHRQWLAAEHNLLLQVSLATARYLQQADTNRLAASAAPTPVIRITKVPMCNLQVIKLCLTTLNNSRQNPHARFAAKG